MAYPLILPHRLEEAEELPLAVGAVVDAHDRLDGFGRLIGMIEGDGGDEMVKNMGLDDAMHNVPADKSKIAIDCRSRSASEVPCVVLIMRKCAIGVLKVRDSDCDALETSLHVIEVNAYQASD